MESTAIVGEIKLSGSMDEVKNLENIVRVAKNVGTRHLLLPLQSISQMDGGKIEPVDIITFGSPCTDMSVAGRRAGLDGKQSVLFYQAIRIIKEMRCATNGKYPRSVTFSER